MTTAESMRESKGKVLEQVRTAARGRSHRTLKTEEMPAIVHGPCQEGKNTEHFPDLLLRDLGCPGHLMQHVLRNTVSLCSH